MNNDTMDPLELRLPRVEPSAAAASQVLHSAAMQARLRAVFPELGAWRPAAPRQAAAPPPVPGQAIRLVFVSPAAQLEMTVPESLSVAAAAVAHASEWPPALKLACLTRLIQSHMGDAGAWLQREGFELAEASCTAWPHAWPADGEAVEASLGAHRLHARLVCHDPAWSARVSAASASRVPPVAVRLAGVQVPMALRFGNLLLRGALVRTLEAGDVLLPPLLSGGSLSALLVAGARVGGRYGLPCTLQARRLEIVGDRWMNETSTMEVKHGTPEHRPADPLADIEVELHLELRVISTPLHELANMRTGYILELPVSAEDASLDLVVGGQVFGRAQLVSIGDRLGARIVELRHVPE